MVVAVSEKQLFVENILSASGGKFDEKDAAGLYRALKLFRLKSKSPVIHEWDVVNHIINSVNLKQVQIALSGDAKHIDEYELEDFNRHNSAPSVLNGEEIFLAANKRAVGQGMEKNIESSASIAARLLDIYVKHDFHRRPLVSFVPQSSGWTPKVA